MSNNFGITEKQNDVSQPQLSHLDKVYNTALKNQLDRLKKQKFIGTTKGTVEGSEDAACTIDVTSQYEVLDLTINPLFLLHALREAQIDTNSIEIDALVQICITLGESIRLAFNNAKEKISASSDEVFNNIIKEIQADLLSR